VLEGLQGWYKSTVWRVLASNEWFTDALPDLHTKDAAQALRGKWIIEFAELDSFKRAEIETIKRFISATQDHYRPSYGRRALTFPRGNIFVGTTNKWTYLLDETGNRRYLPVRVQQACDIDALRRDRDQLWAEAKRQYDDGKQWYIDDSDLLKQAEIEQADRTEEDPWTEPVRAYLASRKARPTTPYKGDDVEYVTTGEILTLALQIERTHWNAGTSRRIAAVLRFDGWEYTRIEVETTGGQRVHPKAFIMRCGSPPHKTSSGPDGPDGPDSLNGVSPHKTSSGPDGPDGPDSLDILPEPKTPLCAREISGEEGSCGGVEMFIKTANLSGPSGPEALTPVESELSAGPDAQKVSGPSGPNPVSQPLGPDAEVLSISVLPTVDPGDVEYIRHPARAVQVLPEFISAPFKGLDIETTGLDPLTHRIRLVQVAIPGKTAVLDMQQVPYDVLKPLLTAPGRFVGHNAKFELRFLAAAGLPWPTQLSDTMHLAQLLGASAEQRPKGYYSLEAVVERELVLSLDKTLQTSDWSGELSHEQILYAARDAAAELPLYHRLTTACTKAQLDRIRSIEEACLPALAWMESVGVLIDEAAWQARSEHDQLELGIIVADLCTLLHEAEAAGVVLPKPPEAMNWNSPPQVLKVLQALGADTITSTAEVVLTRLAPEYPLAARLLEHRHFSQRIKNGGAKWLRAHVHEITHRVHADYQQIGSRAGRMSCREPNMQQIPKSTEYRTSIIAAPGNAILKADYGQLQLRLAAVMAPEPVMLDALRAGHDLHRRTAAYVLGCDEAAVTPEQRTLAKAINFGLLFGMGAQRFREQARTDYKIQLTLEEATCYRNAFFSLYPGLRSWHRACGALKDWEGCVDTRTPLGRRRTGVDRYTEIINTPVQGAEADGFKIAVATLYEHRHEVPEAKLLMCVHDELVAECPAEQAHETAAWMTRHMQAAMDEVVQGQAPIDVEVKIGRDWAGSPLDT
jgi:DNA polymerase-1